MKKKVLLAISLSAASILLGVIVFFVAKKYFPKMPEIFQQEYYCVPPGGGCGGMADCCIGSCQTSGHSTSGTCPEVACGAGCPTGYSCCSGNCRKLSTDWNNCGSCGHQCQAGEACISGNCLAPACIPPGGGCGGRADCCIGSCQTSGHSTSGTCPEVACGAGCPTGYSCCSGNCRDFSHDWNNCGSCGHQCQAGEACISAVCTGVACTPSTSCTSCNTVCSAATSSGCPSNGTCTFKECFCYLNGECGPYCEPHCPTGCTYAAGGSCIVTCSPCGNSLSCSCGTPPPPSSPPPPPPSSPPPPPPSSPPPPPSSPPPPPSSPPPPSLICTDLVRNPTTTLNIGDQVTFTCSHQIQNLVFNHYNYRYNIDNGSWQNPTGWQGIPGTTPAFTIEQAGVYLVQCQVCISQDNNQCTIWGQAQGPLQMLE